MYGVLLAFAAAVLFATSVPASKLLLQSFDPVQLAGLLYLGAAVAMVPVVRTERRRFARVQLDRANRVRLAGVVVLGGMVAPILLLMAFRLTTAGAVALLLNFEIAATAVLGSALFHEHMGRGAWLGVVGVVAASVLLCGEAGRLGVVAALLVAAACTCWGIDNLLSALIDGMTPARSTLWKGAVAGATNLALGLATEPVRASAAAVVGAVVVGAVSYGASIALHTAAAQRVGAIRAQGVFASAPFVGAALSLVIFGDRVTALQATATVLFLISVVVLVASAHEHQHRHVAVGHIHAHTHDDGHHLHEHPELVTSGHTHWHSHESAVHAHAHWPDLHHRHPH
jgi:drug/metabolite transporter (DMT)-like permease